ncbi:MAG: glycine zipper 2TM domain-containing protein [Pseudomonadota bacterium]|nr:glycine zipper 2TM domain-containing protein [Pseudomonadota bacterium]
MFSKMMRGSAAITLAALLGFAPAALSQVRCNNDCGRVQSIRNVERQGEASGLGAVAGGVVGGVLGHQIGSGRGNTVATVAGAAGGAYAGHEIEKNRKRTNGWSVAIRMDSGSTRTLSFASNPGVHEGERVKVMNGGRRLARVSG